MTAEKNRESRLRRLARREGFALRKDRTWTINLNHQGGYQIVDPYGNWVTLGSRFELDRSGPVLSSET